MTDRTEAKILQVFDQKGYNSVPDQEILGKLIEIIKPVIDQEASIEKVYHFHDIFGQVTNHSPCIPDSHTMKLRLSLIFEEVYELAEACGAEGIIHIQELMAKKVTTSLNTDEILSVKPSPVDALDALVDIQYVLDGAKLAFGMRKVFEVAFDEVHDSNMSKASDNEDTAEATKIAYELDHIGTNCSVEEREGKFFVYRQDRKLIKSIHYRPANLKQFIPDGI